MNGVFASFQQLQNQSNNNSKIIVFVSIAYFSLVTKSQSASHGKISKTLERLNISNEITNTNCSRTKALGVCEVSQEDLNLLIPPNGNCIQGSSGSNKLEDCLKIIVKLSNFIPACMMHQH